MRRGRKKKYINPEKKTEIKELGKCWKMLAAGDGTLESVIWGSDAIWLID